jgi:hypothetical protein
MTDYVLDLGTGYYGTDAAITEQVLTGQTQTIIVDTPATGYNNPTIPPVPLPPGVVLFITGLAMLGILRRKRNGRDE